MKFGGGSKPPPYGIMLRATRAEHDGTRDAVVPYGVVLRAASAEDFGSPLPYQIAASPLDKPAAAWYNITAKE